MTDNIDNDREFNYTAADFEQVRRILHRKSGINLSESKSQLVYSRLARRLRVLQLPNFSSYLSFLDSNAPEQEEFINALTTNLTAFFREAHHFDILADYARKMKSQRRTMRVWCAASSTGEEPYSIAMALVEAFADYNPPVEIIASDIDSNVLREASAGIYTAQRLENVSIERKKQFFQRGKGANSGRARVASELRQLIEFRQLNLLDANWSLQGPFDIIFCRNVMIYFDKPTQLKLIERMVKFLRPEGLYIAGHSESFAQASHIVKLIGKTTYSLVPGSQGGGNEF